MANNKDIKRGISIYLDGKEVKNNATAIQAEMRKLKKEINGMTIGSEEYVAATKKYRELQGILAQHKAQLHDIGKEHQSLVSRGVSAFNSLKAGALAAVAAISGIYMKLKESIEAYSAKEDSQANLKALTGLDDDSISWLTKQAETLSTTMHESGLRVRQSSKEILEAYMLVGSAKPELLSNKEALNAVTVEAMRLAEAAKMELKAAVDGVTLSLNQYGAGADEAAKYVNVLAAGSKFGAASVESQTASIIKAGVAASTAKVPIEQLVGSIETLAERGIKGEAAGTGLKTFFLKLEGMAADVRPSVVGLQTALENLQKKGMSAAEMQKTFGLESYTVAQAMIEGAAKVKEYTEAVTGTNTATEQAAINSDTLSARIAQIKNRMTELGIQLINRLMPSVKVVTKAVQDVVKWFSDWYKESMVLRGVVSSLVLQFKLLWGTVKLVFNNIVSSVKAAGRSLKGFGEIIEGIVTFDADKIKEGWNAITSSVVTNFKETMSNFKTFATEATKDAIDAVNTTLGKEKIKPVEVPVTTIVSTSYSSGSIDDSDISPTDDAEKKKKKTTKTKTKSNSEAEERKRIQQQLAAIDLQYDQQVRAAREARMAGEIADAEALSKKLQEIELARLADKLRVQGMEESQVEALKTKVTDIHLQMYEELERQLNESAERQIETEELKRQAIEQQNTQLFDTMKELATSFGENLGIFLADTETSLGDFAKNTIKLILDTLEKILVASIAERTMKNVGALGFLGLAKNAGEIALLTAAFEAAKVGLSNMWTGGFTPSGKWNDPQGIVHSDEFVANRYAVANPAVRPVLDLIDRAQHSGNIANLTSSDIAAVASSPFPKGSPSGLSASDNAELRSLLLQCAKTMESATEAFQQPSLALCTIEGEGGVNTQQKLLDRIKSNAHRK